jgi:hypothetical protein
MRKYNGARPVLGFAPRPPANAYNATQSAWF